MSDRTREQTDWEDVRVLFEQVIPFNLYLGIRVRDISKGFASLEIPFRPELIGNPVLSVLHGGVTSTLLDSCGGAAVWSQIGPKDVVATVDLRVDFLRPARSKTLIGTGRVVRLGNRVGVVELRAHHPGAADSPVAAGTGVYNIRRSSGSAELWRRLREQRQG